MAVTQSEISQCLPWKSAIAIIVATKPEQAWLHVARRIDSLALAPEVDRPLKGSRQSLQERLHRPEVSTFLDDATPPSPTYEKRMLSAPH